MIRRALRVATAIHGWRALQSGWDQVADDIRQWALCCHDHLKVCSCWMCGNPRKYGNGPPLQQLRLLTKADAEERAAEEGGGEAMTTRSEPL